MNFYEHTIIARQDTSPSQIKQIQDKYSKIIENNEGNIIKYERCINPQLSNLSIFPLLLSMILEYFSCNCFI